MVLLFFSLARYRSSSQRTQRKSAVGNAKRMAQSAKRKKQFKSAAVIGSSNKI